MNFFIADDEKASLDILQRAILAVSPDAQIQKFSNGNDVIACLKTSDSRPDVAFLDIEMPGMNGLSLAAKIKELSPMTNIIFVTAYSSYALDAFQLHTSGYLIKPATPEKIRDELNNLRVPTPDKGSHVLRVQCFGNFEVFANGKPLSFAYSKTKELLAYLIDRNGASCNTGELCAVLWEDKPDSIELRNYLRKLLADLSHTLASVQAEEVFIKRRNQFSVATGQLDCDYYEYLRSGEASRSYVGEYMTQYSWAEKTLSSLQNIQ